jgi:hypothetical protein
MLLAANAMSQDKFISKRISRTASFVLDAHIEDVFPLFGPIKEKLWAEGWNPSVVYAKNNFVEQHMVFQTKGSPEEELYNWTVTDFQPSNYLIEYTVFTANRIWFIKVICIEKDNGTHVSVTYTYTGLNEKGNRLNQVALDEMFARNLVDWHEAVAYFLETGKMLTSAASANGK